MPVRLNGATSGYTELSAPAVAGITTMTMPTASGTLDRLERAGNILQVVTASTSTEVVITDDTMTDTGLSATITPSSTSSKILILISQTYRIQREGSNFGGINVLRGSTTIHDGVKNTGGGFEFGNAFEGSDLTNVSSGRADITFVDSPSTTSATTYKTQGANNTTADSPVFTFQIGGTVSDSTSYITLMEIAG